MTISFLEIIFSKPALIGAHLVFAIIAIDTFLWVLGEVVADSKHTKRMRIAVVTGVFGFLGSWIIGGYYYVFYYGSLVKPVIKAGTAPWAHSIIMETKEHVFLFLAPLAFTAMLITFLNKETFELLRLRKILGWLAGSIAFIALLIGLAGFIISSAARWGTGL